MKSIPALCLALIGLLAASLTVPAQTAKPVPPVTPAPQVASAAPALALVVVYDGSGSMADPVRDTNNNSSPKYIVANRAVAAISAKLQEFCDAKHTNIDAGLVVFKNDKINEAIPLGNFKNATFTNWAKSFTAPAGNTPLGKAIEKANAMLTDSLAPYRHILVVTDGENNGSLTPQAVLRRMKTNDHPVSVYFVAFDVDAKVFAPVKKEGAVVASAKDEASLRVQLDSIVGKKILLEAE